MPDLTAGAHPVGGRRSKAAGAAPRDGDSARDPMLPVSPGAGRVHMSGKATTLVCPLLLLAALRRRPGLTDGRNRDPNPRFWCPLNDLELNRVKVA